MQKWQYTCLFVNGEHNVVKKDGKSSLNEPIWVMLNRLGEEGWEVVSATTYQESDSYIILKRPKS